MENSIFKTTLKNQGHYDIRLLPNINDLKTNIISFKAFHIDSRFIQNHICHALVDGEIKIWVFGDIVMKHLNNLNTYDKLSYWDVTKNKYLHIKTSEKQGFLYVDINFREDDMYNFNNNRKYILDLFETIKHIKLENVLYQELFKRAHIGWGNGQYYTDKRLSMYDVYCDEYDDFEERYTVWLRNKKIKQIIK